MEETEWVKLLERRGKLGDRQAGRRAAGLPVLHCVSLRWPSARLTHAATCGVRLSKEPNSTIPTFRVSIYLPLDHIRESDFINQN